MSTFASSSTAESTGGSVDTIERLERGRDVGHVEQRPPRVERRRLICARARPLARAPQAGAQELVRHPRQGGATLARFGRELRCDIIVQIQCRPHHRSSYLMRAFQSRSPSPDARAIGLETAVRTASSLPTSMSWVLARVTAV